MGQLVVQESTIWVELETRPTNLNITETISLKGTKWNVKFGPNSIRAVSEKAILIPEERDSTFDRVIRNKMHEIVAHIRNLSYIALDHEVKWGLKGGYNNTVYNETESIYPSIHQETPTRHSSSIYNPEHIQFGRTIIRSLGSNRKSGLKTLLNYWRRAEELQSLGYHSEAYLNFFKILESLQVLYRDSINHQDIFDRFSPNRIPLSRIRRRYSCRTTKEINSLNGRLLFAAKVAAVTGFRPTIKTGLMLILIDAQYLRNGWNVAHKLVRPVPNDEYDAIGQHSDEFDLVEMENIDIKTITRLLILLYVKPGRFALSTKRGILEVISSS